MVQRLDERAFGQNLERPPRHRRDHGDTTTGHAGEQQVCGTHPHERRYRRVLPRDVIGHEECAELVRLLRRQGDQGSFGAVPADDLDPQLDHAEEAMREFLDHVHALDPRRLDGSLPSLEEAASDHQGPSVEPVEEPRPPDGGSDHGDRADHRREEERPTLAAEDDEHHQRDREAADDAGDPDGDRRRVQAPPRREWRRPSSFIAGHIRPRRGLRHFGFRQPSKAPRGAIPPLPARARGSGPPSRPPCRRRAASIRMRDRGVPGAFRRTGSDRTGSA